MDEPNAEQPPAEMEGMDAMDGMEAMDAMEAMGDMEGMDGMEEMDGAMEAAMEAEDTKEMGAMDDMEEAMEEKIDYSSDERMGLFIEHCAETLENFKEEEHWKDEHYGYVNDFLNDPDSKSLFFWNSFDEEKRLRVSNVQAPMFYGESISKQDYQVAYFLKKKKYYGMHITISNIKEVVMFRQIGTDPMEDLLE